MKNYIKIIVPIILLSTSIAFAQDIVETTNPEYTAIEIETTDRTVQSEATKVIYPVIFEKEDRKKLNQDRKIVKPTIEKIFKLTNNKDASYDREITIIYERPKAISYDFMLTEEGLKVWLVDTSMYIKKIHKVVENTEKEVDMLSTQGMYKIILDNDDMYEINVTNMK